VLKNCPNLKMLMTSRETLKLTEEHVFTLEGLPFPKTYDANTPLTTDEAKVGDAVQLFRERAQQVNAQFEVSGQLADVLRICRLVEGLPLGLELAASWVRVMTCADIADEIEQSLEFLSTTTLNVPERHRSLKAAFDYSWKLLNQKEQEVLRKLSVFVGGFRREAASEVAGATIPLLASLVDKSLLRVSPTGRYGQHPLLLQFAREKLAGDSKEQTQTQEKHGVNYCRFLKSQEEAIKGPNQKEVLDAIEEELENIRAAWGWVITETKFESLQQVLSPLCEFYIRRGRYVEGLALLAETETGLSSASTLDQTLLGRVRLEQARFSYSLSRFEQAIQMAQRGLEMVQSSENDLEKDRAIMQGLKILNAASWRLGDYAAAKEYLEKAMLRSRARHDQKTIAHDLANLARLEESLGNYALAEHHLKEALALTRELGNPHDLIYRLNNLGSLYLTLSKAREAQVLLYEGLKLAREIDLATVPYLLEGLGQAASELGNYVEAHTLYTEALQMVQETGDQLLEAHLLANLGKVATVVGNCVQARTYIVEALELAWRIQAIPELLYGLASLAGLEAKQGRPREAARLLNFVLHHPAIESYEKEQPQKLLDDLQHHLSSEDREEAMELGKTMTLGEAMTNFTETYLHVSSK
jgi:predicted ATPase